MRRIIIGRKAVIQSSSAPILGPEPRRKRIILTPDGTRSYSIAFGEPAVANSGIVMQPGSYPPLVLTDEDLGDSIKMQVNCVSTGLGVNLRYAEVIEIE